MSYQQHCLPHMLSFFMKKKWTKWTGLKNNLKALFINNIHQSTFQSTFYGSTRFSSRLLRQTRIFLSSVHFFSPVFQKSGLKWTESGLASNPLFMGITEDQSTQSTFLACFLYSMFRRILTFLKKSELVKKFCLYKFKGTYLLRQAP